jgi:photosystem II stability/assembly factor-like uncharacterized protein
MGSRIAVRLLGRGLVLVMVAGMAIPSMGFSQTMTWEAGTFNNSERQTQAGSQPGSSIIYVATADGIARSSDGGDHWEMSAAGLTTTRHVERRPPPTVNAIVVDPRTPTTVYAATSRGVLRSTDGAATWQPINTGLPARAGAAGALWIDVAALAMSPSAPAVLYALVHSPPTIYGGLFKTTDGGNTWHDVSPVIQTSDASTSLPVDPLLIDAAAPDTVYLDLGRAIYRSDDGGGTWQRTNAPRGSTAILSLGPGMMVSASLNSAEILQSTDRGDIWQPIGRLPLPERSATVFANGITHLVADPRVPTTLYAATEASIIGQGLERRIWRSTDGGATWSSLALGELRDPIAILRVDGARPSSVYVVTRPSPPREPELLHSADGDGAWRVVQSEEDIVPVLGRYNARNRDHQIRALAFDPVNPTTLYVGKQGAIFSRAGDGPWRAVLTFPTVPRIISLRASPSDGSVVYAQAMSDATVLYQSTDAGTTWRLVTSEFAGGALAVDPFDASTLYAGRSSVSLLRSSDAGATWVPLMVPSPADDRPIAVRGFAFDDTRPGTVYVIAGDGIAESRDSGDTWRWISDGLTGCSVTALTVAPTSTASIYAGTSCGIFKSIDAGETWRSASVGIPDLPDEARNSASITSIVVEPGTADVVYAAVNWSYGPYITLSAGGIYKSVDGGAAWAATIGGLPDDPGAVGSARPGPVSRGVDALAVDPAAPATLFAMTSRYECPGGPVTCTPIYALYRTRDGGATWSEVSLPSLDGAIAVSRR